MHMVLTRLGYVVTCVANAQEASVAVGHTRFALALIALHLPDTPGLALARRLREAPEPLGSMPILIFGDARDRDGILASCREARLEGYLPKPISIARLVASVCDLTQRAALPVGAQPAMSQPIVSQPVPIALERLTSFTDGDGQLERELSSLYLSTATLYLKELRGAFTNAAAWERAAHALKGASANIGAEEVARLAAEAEHAPPSPELLERIAVAIDDVCRFFRERAHGGAPLLAPALALSR